MLPRILINSKITKKMLENVWCGDKRGVGWMMWWCGEGLNTNWWTKWYVSSIIRSLFLSFPLLLLSSSFLWCNMANVAWVWIWASWWKMNVSSLFSFILSRLLLRSKLGQLMDVYFSFSLRFHFPFSWGCVLTSITAPLVEKETNGARGS